MSPPADRKALTPKSGEGLGMYDRERKTRGNPLKYLD